MTDAVMSIPSNFSAAIIGAGPMGLSLAALLGRHLPVTLVVRDARRAEYIASHGVAVEGLMTGRAFPRVVRSIAALSEGPPPDAIFVATKTTAIDAVAEALSPCLADFARERSAGTGGDSHVISFQNGIDPGRDLRVRLGCPRVLRMVLNYGASQIGPVTARVVMNTPPHYVGGPDAAQAGIAYPLASVLSHTGLDTRAVDDIEPFVWTKGLLNAATNPVAALTDSTIGGVLDSPARIIVQRLLEEGLNVAEAEGIDLGENILARMWAILKGAHEHIPSMVADIRGARESEVGQLNRQVIRHGQRFGIPTPSHEIVTALIDAFDWRVFERDRSDASKRYLEKDVLHAHQ